ncbi:MAG: DNA repair protein RecN, partial [Brevinematales bacterium]
ETGGDINLRREVAPGNKGRVFINGLQEPVSKLEELGEWLLDIHGQHDHQLLLSQKVHLDILDSYGKLHNERGELQKTYLLMSKKSEERDLLLQDEAKLQEEKTYWEQAVKDIDGAGLHPGEEEELSQALKKMENSERLELAFSSAHGLLYDEETSVSAELARCIMMLKDISALDSRYGELLEILDDSQAKLNESVNLISGFRGELDFDQKVMEDTIDRIELIKDFKRKYRKNTIAELMAYMDECSEKLIRFENRSAELEKLNKEIELIKDELIEKSGNLSKKRQSVALDLSAKVKAELSFLGMEKAEFVVDIKYVKDEASPYVINGIPIRIQETGMDRVEFFISSNPGEDPKPLKKVASGGEISRIMLSLKSVFAESDMIETLVFDEIDVGIGGVTANHVAEKMKKIARDKQVIVITHLPQIAARAENHYQISKFVKDDKTFTKIEKLDGERRVDEITRMLGGESDKSRAHAMEMLSNV